MKNELVFGALPPVSQWGAIGTAGKWAAPQLPAKVKIIPVVRN